MAQFWPMRSKKMSGRTSRQAIISLTKITRLSWQKRFALGLPPFSKKTEAANFPEQVTSLGLPTYRLKVTAEN